MVEDGDHRVLDDLVLQCGDPEQTFPSVAFLDVDPSRQFLQERIRHLKDSSEADAD
jgi:hypothetical protein